MKKIIIALIIGIIVGVAGFVLTSAIYKDEQAIGGVSSPGFWQVATTGVMQITVDEQILSTTTQRALAIICNDSSQVVYLGLDQDIALLEDGTNRSTRLNANGGCLEIYPDNNGDIYWGAVRASSTNETSSNLIITEYKFR